VLDRAHVRCHHVAVVAGGPATVDDLRRVASGLRDLVEAAREWAHADHGSDRETEGTRIDPGVVSEDHPVTLQALQPLGHGRRGEADPAAKLGEAEASIGLEFAKQPEIDLIESGAVGRSVILPSIRRHLTENTTDCPFTVRRY